MGGTEEGRKEETEKKQNHPKLFACIGVIYSFTQQLFSACHVLATVLSAEHKMATEIDMVLL